MTHRRSLRPSHLFGATRLLRLLAILLLAAASSLARAQSDALLQTFQRYDAAKTAKRDAEALEYGDAAVKLSQTEGIDREERVRLLCDVADFAAQAGRDS